jgi:hypothetical protein
MQGTQTVGGSVSVSGGSVAVSELPPVQAQQSGPWRVSVAGTTPVSVVSDPAHPLPVQVSGVEQVARFSCLLDPYAATAAEWKYVNCGSPVPTGKALIIDYYTYGASNIASATILLHPPSSSRVSIGADVPIPPGQHNLALAEQAHIIGMAAEQVQMAFLVAGSGNTSSQVSFFGHYIDQ